jgi:hypothetical protein
MLEAAELQGGSEDKDAARLLELVFAKLVVAADVMVVVVVLMNSCEQIDSSCSFVVNGRGDAILYVGNLPLPCR